MTDKIYDLGNGFWSIRGSFIKNGIIDIGVQSALIKLASGRFIFLDSYALTGDVRQQVMTWTNDGHDVEAVLNVHPFHTTYCEQMAQDFPQATFYGSSRHHKEISSINWSEDLVESEAVAARFAELEFSLPKGIYYISPNENVHASSLLVYHPASKSVYIDDTFEMPTSKLFNAIQPGLGLHPTTKQALINKTTASKQYCDWATTLAHQWRAVRYFCSAHSGLVEFGENKFEAALLSAIDNARSELQSS